MKKIENNLSHTHAQKIIFFAKIKLELNTTPSYFAVYIKQDGLFHMNDFLVAINSFQYYIYILKHGEREL